MRAYHRSQASGNAQQPTPPNTSTGVYSYPGYELSSSSQSPSPLTVHPHATEIGMTPYLRQSPNHMHGHPSPKDEVPPPINRYLGHYTVSGGNDSGVPHTFREYEEFGPVDQVDSYIPHEPAGQISHIHPHMITTSAPQAPILAHPNPSHYRMQMTPRAGEIEDLRHPDMLRMGHPGQPSYQSALTSTPRRNTRGKKAPSTRRRTVPRPLAQPAASQDNDTESLDEGAETVVLSDKCEDDARFIFETRRNLVKSGMKGKGMWEEISRKYEEVYGQRLEKATLQMRLTRTFAKHAIWPEKEVSNYSANGQVTTSKKRERELTVIPRLTDSKKRLSASNKNGTSSSWIT